VRGFDYQELGATNAEGKVIGGQYLAVASAEFERYFLRNWGAAVFVDAGDAFLSGSKLTVNVGAGIGVRWRSPVGIVRLDIAKPVVSDLADQIRFHITIGPDL
jgi:translocation and assembly module TamA